MRASILLCVLLVSFAAAAPNINNWFTLVKTVPSGGIPVLQYSDWYYIAATYDPSGNTGFTQQTTPGSGIGLPNTTLTVVLSQVTNDPLYASAGGLTISPSTLVLDPAHPQAYFRVMSSTVQDGSTDANGNTLLPYKLNFVSNGDSTIITTMVLSVRKMRISGTQLFGSGSSSSLDLKYPTEPLKINLEFPPQAGITFQPVMNQIITDSTTGTKSYVASAVTFSPSTVTIGAKTLSAAFTIMCTSQFASQPSEFYWLISGQDAPNYQNITSITNFNFACNQRTPIGPVMSANAVPGNSSNAIWVGTYDVVNASSLTITPTAADTVFTPASQTITAKDQLASFTYASTTLDDNSGSTKEVVLTVSGDGGNYVSNIFTTFGITIRSFYTNVPTEYVLGVPSKLSIFVDQPVANDVTVALFAANMKFSPATVSFTKGQTGVSQSVDVTPTNLGSDSISFWVSGTDVAFYTPIPAVSVSIGYKTFTVPPQLYAMGTATQFFNQPTDAMSVRVNVPPTTSVTLTPVAADYIFVPPQLTFTPSSLLQTFSAIATNPGASSSVSVQWLVSGPDWSSYQAPSSSSFASVKRVFQVVWSSEVELSSSSTSYSYSSTKQLSLGKNHKVWASVNYAGPKDVLVVTPTNPYFTFSPSELTFTSGTTRIQFTATPTGVPTSGSSTTINYVLSGNAAGLYDPSLANVQSVEINIRSINWWSALLSIDNREDGKLVFTTLGGGDSSNFNLALTANHVKAFSLASFVMPDSSLTITPKCPHVTFSPASVTFKPGQHDTYKYLVPLASVSTTIARSTTNHSIEYPVYANVANFTATAQAAGTHWVYFELSGADAAYTQNPGYVQMTFNQYSASSVVVASLSVVIAALAVLVL